jgi:hypothetical protein
MTPLAGTVLVTTDAHEGVVEMDQMLSPLKVRRHLLGPKNIFFTGASSWSFPS